MFDFFSDNLKRKHGKKNIIHSKEIVTIYDYSNTWKQCLFMSHEVSIDIAYHYYAFEGSTKCECTFAFEIQNSAHIISTKVGVLFINSSSGSAILIYKCVISLFKQCINGSNLDSFNSSVFGQINIESHK